MADPPDSIAVAEALVRCWPHRAALAQLVVEDAGGRITVTLQTPDPGLLLGPHGETARAIRDELRAAVGGRPVELRVLPDESLVAPLHLAGEPETDALAPPPGPGIVPDLLARSVPDALRTARLAGFHLATGDPDGAPISLYAHRSTCVVAGQHPAPGALAPLDSTIVVDIEERGGGESGDREPRRPTPPEGILELERTLTLEDLDEATEMGDPWPGEIDPWPGTPSLRP